MTYNIIISKYEETNRVNVYRCSKELALQRIISDTINAIKNGLYEPVDYNQNVDLDFISSILKDMTLDDLKSTYLNIFDCEIEANKIFDIEILEVDNLSMELF